MMFGGPLFALFTSSVKNFWFSGHSRAAFSPYLSLFFHFLYGVGIVFCILKQMSGDLGRRMQRAACPDSAVRSKSGFQHVELHRCILVILGFGFYLGPDLGI